MSEPAPPLDSRKLSCLQHMGIAVWQRRTVAPAPATRDAQVQKTQLPTNPGQDNLAPVNLDGGPEPVATAQAQTHAASSDKLLQIRTETAPSDTAITKATAMIVRASLPGLTASPLLADEYQLLRKMMESIGIEAGHWIAVTEAETAAATNSSKVSERTLSDHLEGCGAEILLLLMPAAELTRWADCWADLKHCQGLAPNTTQTITMGTRSLAIAPLCDPRDLLRDGALKRDAWECLKAVRVHLSKAQGTASVG